MAAPDPGLTDLIAAHTLRVVELNEAVRYPECNGCDWVGGLVTDHAAHLASVVEQHTNGRHEWPKTTPTGHTYERPTTYDELNGITADMVQGEIEGWEKTELPPEPTWPMVTLAQREIYRQSVRIAELEARVDEWSAEYRKVVRARDDWRARAEKAEATVARVEAQRVQFDLNGMHIAANGVRAALEWRQQ